MLIFILVPLSWNLTASLSYHIVRTQIMKVTAFFFLFSLSEFIYQNGILPYALFPTFLPQAFSLTQTTFFTPCSLSFFHWACKALPTGATLLGWPNYEVDGRSDKKGKKARLHASCIIIMQKWISFVFADNLDKVVVPIMLMSRKSSRDACWFPPFSFLNSL